MTDTHKGQCFCGSVTVEVTGDPVAQGYCHCADCRAWSAAPVTAYAMWPAGQVEVTAGEEHLSDFNKTGFNRRRHCTKCGGNVMSVLDAAGLVDIYPVLLAGFAFQPTAHVQYLHRVMDMKDDLPKFRDFPEGFGGGSGELITD